MERVPGGSIREESSWPEAQNRSSCLHYCAATGPVATATFSPKGNCGDLSSIRSLGAKDSVTGSKLGAIPMDTFSDESLSGKSEVDCEDLQGKQKMAIRTRQKRTWIGPKSA